MDVVFGWLFVSSFLSKIIQIESSFGTLVGTFHVLRKHPQLRQCADKALQKHVYVGARISDQTGVCEGLPHSWGRNQTIESGFGYVKNVHVRINYEPPLEGKKITLYIPGILNTGAKIDIHMTWMKFDKTALFMHLFETSNMTYARSYGISFYPGRSFVTVYDKHSKIIEALGTVFDLPHQFRTTNQWKISFVAQRNNTLYMLVDDEVVNTQTLTSGVRLNYLTHVTLSTNDWDGSNLHKPGIRSFEFNEA